MQKDPEKRKCAEALLQHPFITKRRDTNILKQLLDEKRRQSQMTSHKLGLKADRRRKLPSVDLDFAWDFGTVKTLKKDTTGTIFVVEDHLGTVQELKVSNDKTQNSIHIPDSELATMCRLEWKGDTVRSVQLDDGTVFKVESANSYRGDNGSQTNGTVVDRGNHDWRRLSKDSLQLSKPPIHNFAQASAESDSTNTVLCSSSTIKRNGTNRVSGTIDETVRCVDDTNTEHKSNTVLTSMDCSNKLGSLYTTNRMEDMQAPSVFREVLRPVLNSFRVEMEKEHFSAEWSNALSNLEKAFRDTEQIRPGFSAELVEKIIATLHDSSCILPERLKVSISPCTVDGRYEKGKESVEDLSASKFHHARRKTFA